MRYLKTLLTAGALSGILVATTAVAQTSQRVAFARGNDNTSVTGSITGHQYRDYLVGARAGQRMGVSMIQKAKTAVYFNILPPGSTDEAIYNSSVSGDDATGIPLTKTAPIACGSI